MSADEQIYMEWFIHRTTQKLPGAFRLPFWTALLPQASLSEPAVLHAVLSLGSVHRRQALNVGSTTRSSNSGTTEAFALQQYNLAINDLRRRMRDQSKISIKVALITCAVFIQLEYLRGFYKTALTHLRHGLILLEKTLHSNGNTDDDNRDMVNEWITQTFTTMLVQAKLYGEDIRPPRLPLVDKRVRSVIEPSQLLSHARQRLECILLGIMGLKSKHEQCMESVSGDQSALSELTPMDACASIQVDLDIWIRAYEGAICEGEKTGALSPSSAVDRFAWKLLQVYHTLAQVMIAECVSEALASKAKVNPSTLAQTSAYCSSFGANLSDTVPSANHLSQSCIGTPPRCSTSTDDTATSLIPLFDSIIAQCDVLFKWAFSPSIQTVRLYRRPADRDRSHAIADIGWIPPIFYTALHCRHHCIKSKAIKMLRLVPHREGIWDSLMAATIAEKALGIERHWKASSEQWQDLREKTAVSNFERCNAFSLESVRFRMRDVRVDLPEGPNGKLVFNYSMSRNQKIGWIPGQHTYDLRSSCWSDFSY